MAGIGCGVLFASLFLGCQLMSPDEYADGAPEHTGSGAMLVSAGGFLYLIGGTDATGHPSTTVLMASVDAKGTMGPWQETAPLPEGRTQGAAFAVASSAGTLLYVLGGEGPTGPRSTIYYTFINLDGTLGFNSPGQWETSQRPLPGPLSRAAWVLNDGRIFLIGGVTAGGVVGSIIQARLNQDGQLGQWYASPLTLPSARYGSAATIQGFRLYVAGGSTASRIESEVVSYSIGAFGLLGDRQLEPSLPVPLFSALFLSDQGSMLAAGGYGTLGPSDSVYRYSLGAWKLEPQKIPADGPSQGRMAGALLYLGRTANGNVTASVEPGLGLAPEAPLVAPGSGLVTTKAQVQVQSEPGTTVHFRLDSAEVTQADPVWNPNYRIGTDIRLSLRSFSPGLAASPQVYRNYRTRAGSFLFMVEPGSFPIQPAGQAVLKPYILQETLSSGPPVPQSSAWFRVTVNHVEKIKFEWADKDSSPDYTGRIELSLFEADLYTEVLDRAGRPVTRQQGPVAGTVPLELNPGDYFLSVRDVDGMAGRNFGVALSRE